MGFRILPIGRITNPIENHKIYILQRSGFEVTETFGPNYHQILEARC